MLNNNALIKRWRSQVVGLDTKVPLGNGSMATSINFDNAATTPPFKAVIKNICNFAPWYSSIHRGAGFKSQLSSHIYELARYKVASFVKANPAVHDIIFVKNTTEAINKMAYRLWDTNKKQVILCSDMEHHSNDLPWRDKFHVDYIGIDDNGRLMLDDLEDKLRKYGDKVALVAITGASNVTGHINPIHKIAQMVHSHGTKLLVDGAQLVPHAPVDMKPFYSPEHIDFLTFSAHKMYAPFGIGVLIGPKEFFRDGAPELRGGGTVKAVTHDFVCWADSPHKEEAGTPNLMGVVALSTAIDILNSIGMNSIETYERTLTKYAISKMAAIPNIKIYGDIENIDNRVAIISFNIKDLPHGLVASALSYESAISVRSGCFCAHPYIQKLLGLSPEEIQKQIKTIKSPYAGMVRVSFGLYNTKEEIDLLVDKLWDIALNPNEYKDKYRPI